MPKGKRFEAAQKHFEKVQRRYEKQIKEKDKRILDLSTELQDTRAQNESLKSLLSLAMKSSELTVEELEEMQMRQERTAYFAKMIQSMLPQF